ncbi:hypothetical protein CANCADRAFT_57814 [Tortispora caseinolytica NRRL Y-17796]|uniref:non-specific serine/threonine protein kinase n=1 Tax=Tortispora caseinolytica NRRL Y-17796 TaxID=767744 RepID=A0A1E4TAB4_9ASCO|nr:hypothetical protein CANCADRAFT_57814 [Tortispora caseinolytica NRRL Y-17796]
MRTTPLPRPAAHLRLQDTDDITTAISDNKENGTAVQHNSRRFTVEEMAKLQDPKVNRIASVTQLFFLDYYFDFMTYVGKRQKRIKDIKSKLEGMNELEQQIQWRSYAGKERALLRKRRIRLKFGDFQVLTQVGQGGYGQVYLARKSDTKEVCALKVMNKRLLHKLDEINHVLTERDVLTQSNSPWLVNLLYAFQDPSSIYLAMEYVPGGDFRTLLNNTGILHPQHARFYISEMFMAVEALHSLGYIHRDLKPENFLIDAGGHIKLTDFGLSAGKLSSERVESMRCKLDAVKDIDQYTSYRSNQATRQSIYRSLRKNEGMRLANSIVGSPDYMALEVLEGKKYDFTIDYWSLGCMLFEGVAGYPPFSGASVNETYANLRRWRHVLRPPVSQSGQCCMSARTWELITHLIAYPHERPRSFKEIQKFSYFSEVDWSKLRETNPPFVPQLDSDTDAGYFDDFSNEADMAKYKEVQQKQQQVEKLADKAEPIGRTAFVGFTFRRHKTPLLDRDEKNETTEKDTFSTFF